MAFNFGAAPTTGGFNFGSFGSPAAPTTSAPASTGFNFTASAPPADPAASSGLFSFSSAVAPSSSAPTQTQTQPAGGGGITWGTNTYASAPSYSSFSTPGSSSLFAPTQPPQPQPEAQSTVLVPVAPAAPAYSMDTPYADLPDTVKTEIDKLYSVFKLPVRDILADLKRVAGNFAASHHAIAAQIRAVKLNAMSLQQRQEELLRSTTAFLGVVKGASYATRQYGVRGMLHVQKHSVMAAVEHDLPIAYYSEVLRGFDGRLEELGEAIDALMHDLGALMDMQQQGQGQGQGQGRVGGAGAGSGAGRVSLVEVADLICQQSREYNALSHTVLLLHEEVVQLKQWYLLQYCSGRGGGAQVDPFEQEDRKEAAAKRKLSSQMLQHVSRSVAACTASENSSAGTSVKLQNVTTTGNEAGAGAGTATAGAASGGDAAAAPAAGASVGFNFNSLTPPPAAGAGVPASSAAGAGGGISFAAAPAAAGNAPAAPTVSFGAPTAAAGGGLGNAFSSSSSNLGALGAPGAEVGNARLTSSGSVNTLSGKKKKNSKK